MIPESRARNKARNTIDVTLKPEEWEDCSEEEKREKGRGGRCKRGGRGEIRGRRGRKERKKGKGGGRGNERCSFCLRRSRPILPDPTTLCVLAVSPENCQS